MKLGILGTGKIVQEFLPWLVEHTPFTVQAVCSTPRSAAKAAELCAQYQIPQHTTNYFELLQWVDAVYIAVPNLQHARYARVALEAGKHVIVEKPAGFDVEHPDAVVADSQIADIAPGPAAEFASGSNGDGAIARTIAAHI